VAASFVQAVTASFSDSIGDIVFVMEDAAVSILSRLGCRRERVEQSHGVLLAGRPKPRRPQW
jgi:hypothetical protein